MSKRRHQNELVFFKDGPLTTKQFVEASGLKNIEAKKLLKFFRRTQSIVFQGTNQNGNYRLRTPGDPFASVYIPMCCIRVDSDFATRQRAVNSTIKSAISSRSMLEKCWSVA